LNSYYTFTSSIPIFGAEYEKGDKKRDLLNGIKVESKVDQRQDSFRKENIILVCGIDAFDKIWRNIKAFIDLQKAQDASKPEVSL
jgi:hypothetical protein